MNVLYFMAEHRNSVITAIYEVLRIFGEESVILLIIGYLYLWKDKKIAYDIGFGYFFACLTANSLKVIVREPRPWMLDPNFKPLASATKSATGYSFPSVHSQSAASVYGTLACDYKNKIFRGFCILIVVVMPFLRMYAGVHTPKDVIVGFLIGIIAVVIEQKFIHPYVVKNDPAIIPCVILGVMSVITIGIALTLISLNKLDASLSADVFKTAGASLGFAIAYPLDIKVIKFDNTGTFKFKLISLIAGVLSLLAIKESLKILFAPIGVVGDFIRYVIVIAWIMIAYPMIIMAIKRKKGYNK